MPGIEEKENEKHGSSWKTIVEQARKETKGFYCRMIYNIMKDYGSID